MKPGNQTTELYVTVISSLVGAGSLFGIVASDQAAHLINAGVTIVSALIAIAPAVAYIYGRTWLKGKAISNGYSSMVTTPTPKPTEVGA